MMLTGIRRAVARIENSWIGDLIGAVALLGSVWMGLTLATLLAGGAP